MKIGRSALALNGSVYWRQMLDSVHGETFKPYIEARRTTGTSKRGRRKCKPLSVSTLNRNIGVARRVLRLAATVWREADSNLTWLAAAPLIQLESARQLARRIRLTGKSSNCSFPSWLRICNGWRCLT